MGMRVTLVYDNALHEGGNEGGICGGIDGGGGGGACGGCGAQHLVTPPETTTSKYEASESVHPPSPNTVAHAGHGHVSSRGMQLPPDDAQHLRPPAQIP